MLSVMEKLEQKKKTAYKYSMKFNNYETFYVLNNGVKPIVTNNVVEVGHKCDKEGYRIVSSFTNGKETIF